MSNRWLRKWFDHSPRARTPIRTRPRTRLQAETLEDRTVPSNVAVFDNNSFVDTSSGSFFAESDNIQASLSSLGHTVNTFTGITAADFAAAEAGSDLLLIPEQENGALAPALSGAAIPQLQGS